MKCLYKNFSTRFEHFAHALVWFCWVCLFFFHRFTEVEDYRWFYKTIERVAEEELGSRYQPMVKKEEYFVDFLRYHFDSLSRFILNDNNISFPLIIINLFVIVEMLRNPQVKSLKMPI